MITRKYDKKEEGFTLVELMIVVVIIGILAAIAIPIFANQQKAAFEANAKSDLRTIVTAITLAKAKTNKPLYGITTEAWSANECMTTDYLNSPQTSPCWMRYNAVLQKVSDASGVNIVGMVDPYGRPYYINANEKELGATDCRNDTVGYFDSSGNATTPVAGVLQKMPATSAGCTG